MSEQELETGDASLSLSRVTVSDEGPYQCVVGYGAEQLQGETTLRVLGKDRRRARTFPGGELGTGCSRVGPTVPQVGGAGGVRTHSLQVPP